MRPTTRSSVQVVVPTTPLPFVVTPPPISRISSGGGDHFGPVMSADGQYIVYDPDGAIYLYDRQTNTTITIATPGGGFTYSGQTISADGHHVVFQGTDGTNSYVFIYNNDPSDTAHYQHTIQLVAGGAPAISRRRQHHRGRARRKQHRHLRSAGPRDRARSRRPRSAHRARSGGLRSAPTAM